MRGCDKRKKVLIAGYDNVNLGDDLFFWIVCNNFPECELYFVTKLWSKYRRILPFNNLHIIHKTIINRVLNRAFGRYIAPIKLKAIKLDAILYIGGSVFMEEADGSCYTIKSINGLKSLYKSVPLYIAGSNYGPERTPEFRVSVAKLFASAQSVCLRDSYSYNLFSNIESVHHAADVVFQLDTSRYKATKSDEVGISMIELRNRNFDQQCKDRYIESIITIIREQKAENRRVTLFSFCENEGDLSACEQIKSLLDTEAQSYISIVSYNGDIEAFINEFISVGKLYATRFHAIILGLLFQIRTIPIIYSNKTLNMLNDLSLGDYDRIDIRDSEPTRELSSLEPILLSPERLEALKESSRKHLLEIKKL